MLFHCIFDQIRALGRLWVRQFGNWRDLFTDVSEVNVTESQVSLFYILFYGGWNTRHK